MVNTTHLWKQWLLRVIQSVYSQTGLSHCFRVIVCGLVFASAPLLAVELAPLNLNDNVMDLSGKALILHDPHDQHSPQTALAEFNSPDFISSSLDTNGQHYWYYLPIYNTTKELNWTLVSNNALFDNFDFYWHCNRVPLVTLPRPEMGMASESIDTSYHVDITIPSNTQCGLLQQVSIVASYPLQNYLMTASYAERRSKFQTILCVAAFGVIIGLAIYNLLLSISLLNLNYLLYSAYALVNLSCLVLITFRPFSAYYDLIPSMNWFRISGASANILFILFTIRFMRPGLEIAEKDNANSVFLAISKTLIRWRFLPYAIMFFFIAESFLSPNTLGITGRYYPVLLIICSFYIPILSLAIALTGYRPAYVFLIAWTILSSGNIAGMLDLVGAIELNGWARSIAIVGASLEMILLSIALAMNMRESQKAEERAQRAREQAETLMQRQDKFVSTLSHEIRTPLHAILGATNLLAKTELNATQTDYWSTTHYAAESMHALVDNLLDRAEAKNTQRLDEKINFDPTRLLEAMVQLLKPRALEKKVPVTLTMHSIPDLLLGNPLVIRRLLINLISNSIKYTEHGSIDISVVWQASDKRLKIIISDTGKGISAAHLKQLNTRFNKGLESYYSEDSSSGLGLAICHELISNSGGQLTIQSELNLGTTVTVELDLDLPTSSTAQPAPSDPAPSDPAHSHPRPPQSLNACVLVVDGIEQIIKQSGYTTLSAANGKTALEILTNNQVDVLVSDLRMPEMDGVELLKALKNTTHDHSQPLRIVITSAHLNAVQIEQLLALGADQCLAKPYRPEQLESVIADVLTKQPEQRQETKNSRGSQAIQDDSSAVSESVADHLGATVYAQVLDMFQQQATEDMSRIVRGINDQNLAAVSIAAHRIVSASKALGFNHIADMASNIEEACIADPSSPTHSSAHKIEQYLQPLRTHIHKQVNKRTPT